MYAPQSTCSTLLHLLVRFPILVLVLGIGAAATEVSQRDDASLATYSGELAEDASVQKVLSELEAYKLRPSTPPYVPNGFHPEGVFGSVFVAMQRVESGMRVVGKHPDGVSHGPAGLTRTALEDLFQELPSCETLGYDEVLSSPYYSTRFAYLYFLSLLHDFRDLDTAIIAYNFGPERTRQYLNEGKTLPTQYLTAVKKHLHKDS